MSKKKIKHDSEKELDAMRIKFENMIRDNVMGYLEDLTNAVTEGRDLTEEIKLHWRGVTCHSIIDILSEEAMRIDEKCSIDDIVIPGTGREA